MYGKRVILRVDFNVPLHNGRIDKDGDQRLRAVIPTLRYLCGKGAIVILISHLGRPDGKWDKKFGLNPVAHHLEKLIKKSVHFFGDKLGSAALSKKVKVMKPGEIALLENIRFYPGEEKDDKSFARKLASLGQIYVNDAFAVSHRAHASVAAITKFLPSCAGPLLEAEIANLGKLLARPARPYVVLLGGAKISTKIGLIKNLLKIADKILIGGALANNFLKARDAELGASFYEKDYLAEARNLLTSKKIMLPIDFLASGSVKKPVDLRRQHFPVALHGKESIVDIGPCAIREYAEVLKQAKTIVWNGPLGVTEVPEFSHGSLALARVIAARSSGRAFGVVGGGDTIPVLERTGQAAFVDWVSTGGGAMLEFLEGKVLPGIAPLIIKASKHRNIKAKSLFSFLF
ncbi:MAG: phosphoglycerate kinase [Patescibacteria group bacterium]